MANWSGHCRPCRHSSPQLARIAPDDLAHADEDRDDGEDALVGAVGGPKLSCLAVEHFWLHPLDALLAEEALGPDQQEEEGEDVREPVLDASAQHLDRARDATGVHDEASTAHDGA